MKSNSPEFPSPLFARPPLQTEAERRQETEVKKAILSFSLAISYPFKILKSVHSDNSQSSNDYCQIPIFSIVRF